MKELSVSYINSICAKFEKKINECIERGSFNRAIRFLKALSFIRYKFFLGINNVFIEDNINILSQHIVKTKYKNINNDKSIVIVDEINADYIGLMVQYLSALISGSYQILYIYEQREHRGAVRKHLMQALQAYENAQIRHIPSNINGLSKSQWIYNEICAFGSKNILMHFGEWAIEECVACLALPKEFAKYRINVGDHCFWAGLSCVDYTFEFRHYGANLTNHERGIERNKIIYIPFYPVMQDVPFVGLPKKCEKKLVFLSGGAIYKIVDEENTYFRLCRLIIDKCPDSVILFAGANVDNVILSNGIKEFGLEGRFIPIGYRKDILEVFKHSDVFLNTYPIGGGLMCQYAAQCSKPILNFRDRGDEECVAQKMGCTFTSYNEADFVNEAYKMYSNGDYRCEKGKTLHKAVVSKTEFDNALLTFLETNQSVFEIKWDDNFVPKQYSIEDAINFNNKKIASFYVKLFKILGIDSLLIMPWNVFSLGIYGIKRQLKKMIKK